MLNLLGILYYVRYRLIFVTPNIVDPSTFLFLRNILFGKLGLSSFLNIVQSPLKITFNYSQMNLSIYYIPFNLPARFIFIYRPTFY